MKHLLLGILAVAIISCAEGSVPAGMKNNPRPKEPHTSFQTPTGYLPENDIRTDAVIVYSCEKDRIQSWIEKGYVVQTMYGFRTGDDYIKDHRDEGQTTATGVILTCGPGSYYMVPTQSRIDAAVDYFRKAIEGGTSAVIPEEPEFFIQAGYSDSFKREWQAYYGEPWQDQASSIEARWKSSRLKGYLEYRMVKNILEAAEKQNPNVIRMVAAHSPVTYYLWGIIYPHYQVLRLPAFQDLIAQVWTGTARSACRYEGEMAERTFENGFLEYSSLYNLMRDTGKRVWFLMDPLEDNPDRSMEDYQSNYEKTLVASLMFPEVDEYEVMPWPTRIFGRVPDDFATKIMTIVTMLGDMHNQKDSELDTGTKGIATFVADSMAWQRGDPFASNYDTFYGMTLPFVMRGIPIQVAQLERTPEPRYLDPYRVLLLSYDIMKPMDAAYNDAIAKWVRAGGTLVLLGGTDAYNDLPEWWKKEGFASPQDHLLSALGIRFSDRVSLNRGDKYRLLASAQEPCTNLENRRYHSFDLSPYVMPDGKVYVKIEDSHPGDGFGPQVFGAELKVAGQTIISFTAGSADERRHIFEDAGSIFNGKSRFADGHASWVYSFDAGAIPCCAASATCAAIPSASPRVELLLDMGNQYRVSVAVEPPGRERSFTAAASNSLTRRLKSFSVPGMYEVTAYKANATGLYSIEGVDQSPFFEAKVGKGTVIFCGVAPRYFASSREAADVLRSVVAYACEKAGISYREQHYMKVRRGRYIAVRAFDKPVTVKGVYVDVLDPGIRLTRDPVVAPGELAVLADVSEAISGRTPRILLSSSRIEASDESPSLTRILLSGPAKTKGIVRLSTAGRSARSISAEDTQGNVFSCTQELSDGTIAIRYDDNPSGVLVRVEWE